MTSRPVSFNPGETTLMKTSMRGFRGFFHLKPPTGGFFPRSELLEEARKLSDALETVKML
jgi:hypothetical protein